MEVGKKKVQRDRNGTDGDRLACRRNSTEAIPFFSSDARGWFSGLIRGLCSACEHSPAFGADSLPAVSTLPFYRPAICISVTSRAKRSKQIFPFATGIPSPSTLWLLVILIDGAST